MKKKILAIALLGAMTLSMNSVAFAADTVVNAPEPTSGVYKADVDVSTEVSVPTIKITVPGDTKVAINPYKMAYEMDSVEYTDVLANAEKAIKNESDVAISVSATASAKASEGSEVVLATTALKGTETTKSVFAYLEVAEKTDESTAAAFAESFNTKAANQLALTTKETTKKGMITLAAGDATATYAGFKILGDAAAKPAKAWTTADKMDISLVFSFDPVLATDGN